jgi:hypothetical protein
LFRCHPRTRSQQRYCSAPTCRAASKKASQARWLGKPENQGYFSGPQHVSRVQAWRETHPGYGGKTRRKAPALQETMISQPIERSRESMILPLQDAIGLQVIAAADPTGVRNGSALQDVM